MKKSSSVLWIVLLASLLLGSAAAAVEIDASAVTWNAPTASDLRITGPNGFVFEHKLAAGDSFSFAPFGASGKLLADGLYDWQLVTSPAGAPSRRDSLATDAKRGLEISQLRQGETRSGSFTLAGGYFVSPAVEESADKDQVFTDDLIGQGSACFGFDCVNGESFGADTLRLKENNLRIHFDDTSNSASFPANDWRLVANDTTNGGANYLAIEDSTAGRTPFKVEAGAPNNALVVDSSSTNRIGIGTASPVVTIHAVSGDSPTLRLEQNGSSGFTAQTWDVAGNEASFFVRDATNGSTLPFRIFPGAPGQALVVEGSTGDVGIGAGTNPEAPLHVKRSNQTAKILVQELSGTEATRDLLRVENNGTTRIAMQDTSADGEEWQMAVNGLADALVLTNQGSGFTEFTLVRANTGTANAGDLTIIGNIITGSGNTCQPPGCDALFQNEIESIEEHAAYMWENSHLPGVGPTSPGEPWNLTVKTSGILSELEKAHIYIEQLNQTVKELQARLEELEAAKSE
jgi:hypothetical protein